MFRAKALVQNIRVRYSCRLPYQQQKLQISEAIDSKQKLWLGGLVTAVVAGAGVCFKDTGSLQCESSTPSGEKPRAAPRRAVLHLPPELDGGHMSNSGDALSCISPTGGRLLWFFRHGQSTGNVAKIVAMEADERSGGGTKHFWAYKTCSDFVDAPLTAHGESQAKAAQREVAGWTKKPSVIVCSPLTRAIQTAAIIFERDLLEGHVKLVIRPELREMFPDNNENQGRPISELRKCSKLRSLRCWQEVEEALSHAETDGWAHHWDSNWAQGSSWQAHCGDFDRLQNFRTWLDGRVEHDVAIVSHYGTINNLVNMEPWADGQVPMRTWWGIEPQRPGGPVRRFHLPNCGWVAVMAQPLQPLSSKM
eukprot:TRINITY_DN17656_c3_g1_i1.p1 TRINITY_DN17656_c3_g1~~TRINITY_DN17656_c3_g1_i1.p1  ORF type:complete len:376 (-),score=53.46 TRINITY_DN17656_c3_g1_i1:81-1172(-)